MAHRRVPQLLAALILLLPLLAGCLNAPEAPEPAPTSPEPLPAPATGIDEALLSQPVFEIAPRVVDYAAMPDGKRLYMEVFLPQGAGPWPAILEVSPYNFLRGQMGNIVLAEFGLDEARTALVEQYVPRGYAVVLGHLRGTGNSEGCIDMMGPSEQQDMYHAVEWVAAQSWSDGKVGMHGVSYVGTTPHMAAITAPEHLVTIVTIAGVTNQWRNVYMNGVPYKGRAYPLVYEALVGAPPPTHVSAGPTWALATASGATCVNTEAVAAMSPGTYEKGVYTEYWDARNLTTLVHEANASMLYSQGFIDRAVNPSEAVHWYNEYPAPKKAFFHQAGHQFPPREDYRTVELAWFDHWLKGIENGVMDTAPVEIQTNRDTIRVDVEWPPANVSWEKYHLAPGALEPLPPVDGSEMYVADNWRSLLDVSGLPELASNRLEYVSAPLEQEKWIAGQAVFNLRASVDAENTYFLADLYEVRDGAWTWIAEGWMNAHLREGFDRSAPLVPGEPHDFRFVFEARDWVFEKGTQVGLVIRGNDPRVGPIDAAEAFETTNTVVYGDAGSWIGLPVVQAPQEHPRPAHI